MMANDDYILIQGKDCLPFNLKKGEERVIAHLAQCSSSIKTFHFASGIVEEDEIVPIAEYNPLSGQWRAERLVGEAIFDFEGQTYKVVIAPRFGTLSLFRMLEQVCNIRLISSKQAYILSKDDFQVLIRRLISFIWLHQLAKANKHGLPRHTVQRVHKGTTMRGRLKVSASIVPIHTSGTIVSEYREKEADEVTAQLLLQAYQILRQEYHLGDVGMPEFAADAIEQIEQLYLTRRIISHSEYSRIRYKEIYRTFKPVVDFSWDIIRRRQLGSKSETKEAQQQSFFIDMAEVWELYLLGILTRSLVADGWQVASQRIPTYSKQFFRRNIVPDIIVSKNGRIAVWDAKYKRMFWSKDDVDREDFFQAHTYVQYFQQSSSVIAGGLLYPLSRPYTTGREASAFSPALFGNGKEGPSFSIDGIDLSWCHEEMEANEASDLFQIAEAAFINRIKKILSTRYV